MRFPSTPDRLRRQGLPKTSEFGTQPILIQRMLEGSAGLGLMLLTLFGPTLVPQVSGGFAIAPAPAQAGTCASNCGPKPVRFIPGSLVQVEVVNQTANLLLLEEVAGSDPIPVAPSRAFRLTRQGGTVDNSSVVFWDSQGFPVQVKIKQPKENLLRIEVIPGWQPPGDRSVYLRDDGSVSIL